MFVVAALATSIVLETRRDNWLRSNIFDLLPRSDYDPLVERAIDTTQTEAAERLIFLIGHSDRSVALRAGASFVSELAAHRLIVSVDADIDSEQTTEISRFYFPYRRQILTGAQISSIEADSGARIEQSALASLYSIVGGSDPRMLRSDPFFLFPESLGRLQSGSGNLRLEGGYLWAEHGSTHYMVVSARAEPGAAAMNAQAELVGDLKALIEDAKDAAPGVDVLATGFPLYAHAGTQSAKSEISLIGTASLLGVVLLIFGVFRSLRPLGLVALSIFCGCVSATAATLWIFGTLHLFTLVFGASLIGVSIDYAFHFISESAFSTDERTADENMAAILPGITLGLLTSTSAYLALLVAPFPGLKQLAVFSATGLVGAYATLLACAGPWARPPAVSSRNRLLRACSAYLGLWERIRPRHALTAAVALALILILSLPGIRVDDNIAQLQSRPSELVEQEDRIVEILGDVSGGAFVLVEATSVESLLQREEATREALDELVSQGALTGYQALTRYVPSLQRQQQSELAYDRLFGERLGSFYARIGLDSDTAAEAAERIEQETSSRLTLDDWLSTSFSRNLRFLWLGSVDGRSASIIQLSGVTDPALVSDVLTQAGRRIVDRQADLSTLLGAYRVRISMLLGAAYLGALLLFSFRYGVRGAITVLIPPVVSGLVALAAVSLTGNPINLFNILALILVLGIGIDFTLFTVEAKGRSETTFFAIALSAITTLLSFGMLSLSSTYAIKSFGLTILIGIACAFLLAPLANLWKAGQRAALEARR
jgi:predicted exporter